MERRCAGRLGECHEIRLSALLSRRIEHLPGRIGAAISGGNIDARRFAELCG
jgi:threonine dehydratase